MLVVLVGSGLCGVLAALTGLGGGTLLVPFLTLALGVDFRAAAGVSQLSLVATRVGMLRGGSRASELMDYQVAVLLAIPSLLGARAGAGLAGVLPRKALYLLFGAVTGVTALRMIQERRVEAATRPAEGRWRKVVGVLAVAVAGLVSGLLGIGGGAFNVAVMHLVLGLPLANAAVTSSFLNGVNGLAGLPVYWARGDLVLAVAAPAVLGVMWGAAVGGRLVARVSPRTIRMVFVPVVGVVAVQMFLRGLQ